MYTVADRAGDEAERRLRLHRPRQDRAGRDRPLEGRVSTTLLTPYPPGIPLLIPGEKFNRKIVDYLRFTRAFNKAFPGFDTDVHGLMSMNELQGVGVDEGQATTSTAWRRSRYAVTGLLPPQLRSPPSEGGAGPAGPKLRPASRG